MPALTLYYAIAGALIVVGVIGIILPAVPGLPLMFAGMLLAAWAGGFSKVGAGMLITLGLLTAVSMGMDLWAAAIGARRVGASRLAVIGALVGTVCGLLLGPVGLLVGPFAGALLGELWHGRSLNASQVGKATRVGVGTTLGIVLGVVVKLMLAFAMLGLFVWSWFH
jgi:uncharacterized protein YqgC (DUF456 family)